MSTVFAALPMYDWPETQAETDADWTRLRDALSAEGMDAPMRLARRNADLPAVSGGIPDAEGGPIAPDPAMLPPDEFDLDTVWRHPRLLLAQTCWGPMEAGLQAHVQVVGQPDYSAYEGGEGELYSSAILVRRGDTPPSVGQNRGGYKPPISVLRGKRFAFNDCHSMSGFLAFQRDLEVSGEGMGIFSGLAETGSHRASARAVAEGRADACAVDCRSWALFRRFEPCADDLQVVGWTARRRGLPFITSRSTPPEQVAILRRVLSSAP